MTPEEFVDWLNNEIKSAKEIASDRRNPQDIRTHQYGKLKMAEEVMAKYLTLMPPPTTLN